MIGQGRQVEELEHRIAARFQCPNAGVAVSTGAAALYLALHALSCGPATEVICPTYTCISVLQAIGATGATAVLVDAGDRWEPSFLRIATQVTPRTKAVI